MRQRPIAVSRRRTLLVVAVGTFMSTLDGGMVSVSYPALAESFHTDTSTVLWVSVAFYLTSTGLLFTLGWIGDVMGRRRVYLLGFVIFTLGLLLSSLATSIYLLLFFRVVQGAGSAMGLSTGNAILAAVYPAGQRGKAFGIIGAVVGLGLASGPFLGGLILEHLDWRALFYLRLPVGVLAMLLAWLHLPKDPTRGTSISVNFIGAAALFGSLATFLLMINQGGRAGFTSNVPLVMAGLFPVLALVYILAERRVERPIIDFALFKERMYSLNMAVLFFHYVSQGSVILLTPFYLITSLGYSPFTMGLLLSAPQTMRILLSAFVGVLTDRVGPRLPVAIALGSLAAGMLIMSRLGVDSTVGHILPGLILVGVGGAFFEAPNTTEIMGSVKADRLGTAAASVGAGRQMAFTLGITLAGAIFALREELHLEGFLSQGVSGAQAGANAIAAGFGDALLVGAVLAGVGFLLALIPETRRR